MISNVLKYCRRLQRPFYVHLFNQTVAYRVFHSSQHQLKSNQQQIVVGNAWGWQTWNKFWRSWAPVPTIFGLTILIVWQYSRKLQHRYINDTCSTASQLEIQCYRTIPLRFLSRSWGKLSHVQIPTPLRKFVYLTFSKTYGINLDEVKDDLISYSSLGEFFVRQLKNNVRPVDFADLVSPADGTVLNCGRVTSCCVEQVKGTTYLIKSFLGDNTWSSESSTTTNTIRSRSRTISNSIHHSNKYSYIKSSTFIQNEHDISSYEKTNDYYTNIFTKDLLNRFEDDLFSCEILTSNNDGDQMYNKTKCKAEYYNVEIPVLPKLLDYYIKDVIQSIYSCMSLVIFRTKSSDSILPNLYELNSLSSASPESFSSMSPLLRGSSPDLRSSSDDNMRSSPPPPICTPTAEQEWQEYKKHLLKNPDNDLYQIIVYLAPGDYHRFHSPAESSIKFRRHFQGDLLSVNPCIACWIPDLFVLNERAAYMGTWKHGFFSMVMVGATNVGSIKVQCDETLLTNARSWHKGVRHKDLSLDVKWGKGDEVGEFRMGSTVVLLFEAPKDFNFSVQGGDKVKVGQSLML